jgi:hypothetical protein
MAGAVAAVRFLVELAALAGLAYWGGQAGGGTAGDILLAVATPAAAAVMWGIWAAPRSPRRLEGARRLIPEVLLFGGATAALAAADQPGLAVALGVVAAIDTALVHILEARGVDAAG